MYCPNCGAQLQEGMKFCTNCGAKVQAPVPDAQPIEQPTTQPSVKPTTQPTARRRPKLIVPAVFAAVAAVLYAVILCISVYTTLPELKVSVGISTVQLSAVREMLNPMCLAAAAVLAFLFCVWQYKEGGTSLFAVSCLIIVLYFGLGLLVQGLTLIDFGNPSRVIRTPDISIGMSGALRFLFLYGSGFALFLIEMIFAFRDRIIRKIGIFSGIVLMIMGGIRYSEFDQSIRSAAELFAPIFFGVAVLLIAVLWRPKQTS